MEILNISIVVGFGVGGGVFAAVWKLIPLAVEAIRDSRSYRGTLTEQAFRASGMSIESLITVIDQVTEQVVFVKEERTAERLEFQKIIERYEKMNERSDEHIESLLSEITVLKKIIAKLRQEK